MTRAAKPEKKTNFPKKLFTGLSACLATILLVILIFTVFLSLINSFKKRFHFDFNLSIPVLAPKMSKGKAVLNIKENAINHLVSGSFGDTFSGVGYINDATTMYQDTSVTAFTLPPLYDWQKIDNPAPNDTENFLEPDKINENNLCILTSCLAGWGRDLFFFKKSDMTNSSFWQKVTLPDDINVEALKSISVKALSGKWLVGTVEKEKSGRNIGKVFFFDGNFYPVFNSANTPFISKYDGDMSFGGVDEDWLALYGGYEGIAYQVKKTNTGVEFKNISDLFGLKVMRGGFSPAILRLSSLGKVSWFIYSLTPDRTKFIKLFTDNGNDIIGALDFTEKLSLKNEKYVFLKNSGEPNVLTAKIINMDGNLNFFRFKDNGFNVNDKREITSLDIYNVPSKPAVIKKAVISEVRLANSAKNSVAWFLSNDGLNWQEVRIGGETEFNTDGGTLLWKAVITPENDPRSSMFFSEIRVEYKLSYR